MKPKITKLFANCIPVKGASRGVICDLQTREYHLIPLALYEILTKHPDLSVTDVQKVYANEHDEIISEYFDFLFEKGLVFETTEPERFPTLALAWDTPSMVTNAILDYDYSTYDMVAVLRQLDELNCQAIHLRFFSEVEENLLRQVLESMDTSRIRHIELLLRYQNFHTDDYISSLLDQYQRVAVIALHGAPISEIQTGVKGQTIQFVEGNITSSSYCGSISAVNFCTNVSLFTEGLKFNSCLNRKIGIDVGGNIKNCPSMNRSYGHTSSTAIRDAVLEPEFQQVWKINKNQVSICRDCEFRLICTDCRAYTQDNDPFGKPLKCKYDPYTATWADN